MKKSRLKIIAGLLLCGTIAASSTALAAKSYDMPISGINAKMHGYVDFLEGPLNIADKVYYNSSVYGSDAYMITNRSGNYVQASTDKKKLTKKYVYYGHPISISGAKCGHGGSRAYLDMSCEGSSARIESR